jgi:hypothetical protein
MKEQHQHEHYDCHSSPSHIRINTSITLLYKKNIIYSVLYIVIMMLL